MSGILPKIENKYSNFKADVQSVISAVTSAFNAMFVFKAGDTMNGDLAIIKSSPVFSLIGLDADGNTSFIRMANEKAGAAAREWQLKMSDDDGAGTKKLLLLYKDNAGNFARSCSFNRTLTPFSISLPAYANDAAAGAAGLVAGDMYQITGTGVVMVKQ